MITIFLAVAPATAADKLVVAPPPAWVTPVAIPADDGKAADAPVKFLLRDEQVDLQPGRITQYQASVFKVQTPQGLPAGAVSITWNPDTQTVTVHKLQIHRGAQTIDVLASGQSFTVLRRETNLDNAVLDGQLTASIQPEGLQVGDVIDFAVSISTSDPALGRHVEAVGASWNGVPFARTHLHAQWPASLAMRVQPDGGLAPQKIVRKGDTTGFDIAMDDVQPLILPKGAPLRYLYGRMIEMSDAPSWSAISALLLPLYEKAEKLSPDSALQAEIAKIRAGSADPKARAEAALALVQDRIRYVFLGMNDGGLVPANAETTWSRRFGDCKGKTALLLALLHALGIDAHPVLVSVAIGDGLDKRLPALGLFDHVLVQAVIGGRTYWLDGTRVGDKVLDGIETPNFHWGLPLAAGTTSLVPLVPPPLSRPQTDVAIHIDASNGITLPAPVHIERIVRGDEAVATNIALSNLAGEAHDRALMQFWRQRYDFAEPKTVSASFDPLKRELRLVMDGTTKMDWNNGWYEADHVWVGYKADFTRDPGADRNAPYAVGYPGATHVVETILLPKSPYGGSFSIDPGSDVDQTVAGMEYHRHARIEANRFVVEEENRAVAPEFPASQAAAAEQTLRALAKKSVYLDRPINYVRTPAEMETLLASDTETASMADINRLISQQKYAEAIRFLDKFLAQGAGNVTALAYRSLAYSLSGDFAKAKADLDAATQLAPEDIQVTVARAYYLKARGDMEQAALTFSKLVAAQPANMGVLADRAMVYAAAHKDDLALADAAAVLKQNPMVTEMYLLRANILRVRGDMAGTGHEADALMAATPHDSYAIVVAARIYDAIGRHDDAMHAIDAALALKPKAFIYINRFNIRPKSDVAGRKADFDEALKLEPDWDEVLSAKADFQGDTSDWKGMVETLSPMIARKPGDAALLGRRGIAYAKMGERTLAEQDFVAARAVAKTAAALNGLCWSKGTANIALGRALDECDAALKLAPDAANIRDSRGFILLRLGRLDDAITEYGKILNSHPLLPSSLYGRALAEKQKGLFDAAARDAASALKLQADVGKEFAGYGITL
ncbi:MAG: DUF3857 domain-containing protein [Sphingomonas oligoaromativorans]